MSVEKTRSGRRLSWADQDSFELTTVIGVAAEDDECEEASPPAPPAPPDVEPDIEVDFGVLRIGALYGASAHLPAGTTAAEVMDPLSPELSAKVLSDESNGSCYLWCTCQLDSQGKRRQRFNIRLEGAAQPSVLVQLQARALALPEGRPSRVLELHNNVQLLQMADEGVSRTDSEGCSWRRASALLQDPAELAELLHHPEFRESTACSSGEGS